MPATPDAAADDTREAVVTEAERRSSSSPSSTEPTRANALRAARFTEQQRGPRRSNWRPRTLPSVLPSQTVGSSVPLGDEQRHCPSNRSRGAAPEPSVPPLSGPEGAGSVPGRRGDGGASPSEPR